ncbi:hypothetical protein B0H11DRAFT_528943 [Mycena galericulata]|nr:hypothetical protein B0H11DRAFT_528943 [Mycena galericulata]
MKAVVRSDSGCCCCHALATHHALAMHICILILVSAPESHGGPRKKIQANEPCCISFCHPVAASIEFRFSQAHILRFSCRIVVGPWPRANFERRDLVRGGGPQTSSESLGSLSRLGPQCCGQKNRIHSSGQDTRTRVRPFDRYTSDRASEGLRQAYQIYPAARNVAHTTSSLPAHCPVCHPISWTSGTLPPVGTPSVSTKPVIRQDFGALAPPQ